MNNEQHNHENILQFLKSFRKYLLALTLCCLFVFFLNSHRNKDFTNKGIPTRILSDFGNIEDSNSTFNNEEKFIELPFTDEMKNFYKSIRHFYLGTWSSNNSLKDMNYKQGTFQFSTTYTSYNQSITGLEFRHLLITNILLYDDNYVDKWTDIRITVPLLQNYTIFDFHNKTFTSYHQLSKIYRGEILEKKSEQYCFMNMSYSFKNDSIFDPSSNKTLNQISMIQGFMSSNCSININFEAVINVDNEQEVKGRNYFIFSSMVALLQIFNSIWLFNCLTKYQSHANCLSLITICQSIVWNSYGCLCHFFMAIFFDKYIKFFGVPALIYFLNFTIFEIRLLYKTWANQNINNRYDSFEMRRKMMKYYVIFYIFIFLSLFLVTKFYFIKLYITITVTFTWIPQIIYNFINNNKTSLPLICVIIMSLNKIMIPAYFRGCPSNFFHISSDPLFIMVMFGIMTFEILILYLQNIFGARFFFPWLNRDQNITHSYFKSKSEIISLFRDLDRTDCVICLIPITCTEPNLVHVPNNDLSISIAHLGTSVQNNDNMISFSQRKRFLNTIKHYLLDFHEVLYKKNSGEYMVTPCNHIFHTECLEGWMKQNRICPTCRNSIPEV